MRTETGMSAAFAKAGVDMDELRLRQAANEALEHCKGNHVRAATRLYREIKGEEGTIKAALRFFLLRYDLPDEGLELCAHQGLGKSAPSGNTYGAAEGHRIPARKGQLTGAPAAPIREIVPPPVERWRDPARGTFVPPPANEMTAGQRRAAGRVAAAMAITILDTFKIDGRAVGDWQVGEAKNTSRLKTREAYILKTAASWVANADPSAKLRDVVKVSEMQHIITMATEVSDAA